jgi:hypothetical protein
VLLPFDLKNNTRIMKQQDLSQILGVKKIAPVKFYKVPYLIGVPRVH